MDVSAQRDEHPFNMSALLSATLLRAQSDERLARLVVAGNEDAFDVIVERYRRPLIAAVRRIISGSQAEDVVQQTFMQTWTTLHKGTEICDLRAWLYRVARNSALHLVQRHGYDYAELPESLSGAAALDVEVERRLTVRRMLAGVAKLPDRQREALVRTAVNGERQGAVARDLGVTEGAVRQLVLRARTQLRTAASALTPGPLVSWATRGERAASVSDRVAQLVAGGGSAGGAALLGKAGAVALSAGILAVAGPTVLDHPGPRSSSSADAAPIVRSAIDGPAGGARGGGPNSAAATAQTKSPARKPQDTGSSRAPTPTSAASRHGRSGSDATSQHRPDEHVRARAPQSIADSGEGGRHGGRGQAAASQQAPAPRSPTERSTRAQAGSGSRSGSSGRGPSGASGDGETPPSASDDSGGSGSGSSGSRSGSSDGSGHSGDIAR